MSVVTTIDDVTAWVQKNICANIRLKVPPENETDPMDEEAAAAYQLVQPAAFAMYVPTAEKLPPGIVSRIPSICVRVVEGEDDMKAREGTIRFQLMFSAYDPGTHGKDVFNQDGQGCFVQWNGIEADAYFRRNGDGWRDAWNMVDIALAAVESAPNVGGLCLDASQPISFGALKDQEGIPDFYPYWFAWVEFSLSRKLMRHTSEYDNLL